MDVCQSVGVGARRCGGQGSAITGNRLFQPIQRRQCTAQIVVRRCMVGLDMQHPPKAFDRRRMLAIARQDIAKIVERSDVAGSQLKRSPQRRFRVPVQLQCQ